ncbi:MAG: phosphatidylglycerophosphatase A [Candidatus Krumholzibacteriia bacterium]
MRFVLTLIGTFAYSGFFPVAPATFASLVFLLVYGLVPGGEMLANPVVALVTLAVSIPIATRLEKLYGHDAGRIVIDEVVGLQVVLVAAQPSASGLVLVFFLFRMFDIVKPYPVGRSQKLPAGLGVVADDFLAGLYTRLVLVLVTFLYPGAGSFL